MRIIRTQCDVKNCKSTIETELNDDDVKNTVTGRFIGGQYSFSYSFSHRGGVQTYWDLCKHHTERLEKLLNGFFDDSKIYHEGKEQ